MSVVRLALRRAAADLSPLLTIAALVVATATLAAVAPRVHSSTSDEALARVLAAAPPAARELTIRSTNDYRLDQLGLVDEQVRDSLAGPLRDLVEAASFAVVTPLYDTHAWPSGELLHPRPYAWLKLRHQTGLLGEVRWVAGREPRQVGAATIDGTRGGEVVPRIEVALHRDVAAQLEIGLRDEVLLRPLQGQLGRGGPVLVEVTGLYSPRDPDDVVWDYDTLLREPGLEVNANGELVARYASALAPSARAVKAAAATLDFEWHYPVRTSGLHAGNAAHVLSGLERFALQGFSVVESERTYLGVVPGYVAHSGLQELVQSYLRQAGSAEAVVAMVLAGVMLVAVLVVAFATRLLGRRRAATVRLLRARGASWGQLLGLQVVEMLLVAVPAGVLGHRLAVATVEARRSPLSELLVVALVALTVTWAAVAHWQESRGDRRGTTPFAGRRRRELLEAALVVAAVGGVLLVRRRGVGGTADAGADPLVAVVPLLVSVAAGALALRCYQWLTGPVLHAVGRRRGAVGFVALAAAGRRSGVTSAVVVVLLAGVAFSLFASSITATVRDGQVEAASLAVGADYRVDGSALSDEQVADLRAVDGVSAVAPAFLRPGVTVAGSEDTVPDVTFVAVDAATYPEVSPTAAAAAVGDLVGEPAADAALRVLVTPGVLDAGDELTVALGSGIGDARVQVAGTVDRLPLAGGGQAVLADYAALREAEGGLLRATTLLARGDPGAASGIRRATASWDAAATVADRRQRLATTRALPFVDSTVAIFRIGFLAVAAYGLAAFVMYLLLTTDTRARLLGTLRRLGMTRAQTRSVAGLETVPLVALSLLAGTATGVGLAHLLVPAVELVPFTGGAAPPDTVVSPWFVGALALAVAGVAVAATLAVTALVGRRRSEDLVRTGADE